MGRGGDRAGFSIRNDPMPEHLKLKMVGTRLLKKTIAQLEQEKEAKGPFIRKLVEQHYKEVDKT